MDNKSKKRKKKADEDDDEEPRESAASIKARQKGLKLLATKEKKNLKPEEAIKLIRVVIDQELKDVTSFLESHDVSYVFRDAIIPRSVTWERTLERHFINEFNSIDTIRETQEENHILLVWNWDEVLTKISDSSFVSSVGSICSMFSDKRLTLVVCGMEKYFSRKRKGRASKNNEEATEVSRINFEEDLAEIQIRFDCTSRLIENSEDLALMVYQFSKAIADLPFKAQRNEKLRDKTWYVYGDNKDSVKVDKDGYGLSRLWEKQLCQFNLSTLEIAQAISFVYKSPAELMNAYKKCSRVEGETLLKDIPLRREAAPVASKRKVGLEMSKKMYVMFTSEDGNEILHS